MATAATALAYTACNSDGAPRRKKQRSRSLSESRKLERTRLVPSLLGTPASDWSDPAHPIAKHRQASKLGDADQPPPALTYPPKHPKPRAAALDDDDAWTLAWHRGVAEDTRCGVRVEFPSRRKAGRIKRKRNQGNLRGKIEIYIIS